jgi:hypothetical protein
MEKYQANYPGLKGKDLKPKGYIELDPITTNCISVNNIEIEKPENKLIINTICTDGIIHLYSQLTDPKIFNLQGNEIKNFQNTGTEIIIDSNLPNGVYFLNAKKSKPEKFIINR